MKSRFVQLDGGDLESHFESHDSVKRLALSADCLLTSIREKIKWQRYKALHQKKKALLAEINDINQTISRLGGALINISKFEQDESEHAGPKQSETDHKKLPRRDSGIGMSDADVAPYVPLSTSSFTRFANAKNTVNDSNEFDSAKRAASFDYFITPRYISLPRPEVNAKVLFARK